LPLSHDKTMASICVSIFILMAATLCAGYPAGGPYYSCKGLLPGHGDGPKKTAPPYRMSVSQATVESGGSTSVTLSSIDVPFMGFMCAASKYEDEANNTVGEFSRTDDYVNITQLVNCSGSTPYTGITHVSRNPKNTVVFNWSVPDSASSGSVFKIRCTFVQSFNVYWIDSLVNVTVDNKISSNENSSSVQTSTLRNLIACLLTVFYCFL
ncbi:defense protein 3, partial [Biomphalaria glabrata]